MGKELEANQHVEPVEIDTFSVDNPHSIINLLPRKVVESLLAAKEKYPQYFNKPEKELFKILKADCFVPDRTDDLLRVKFWNEYDRAQVHGTNMVMAYVTQGVCEKTFFNEIYLFRAPRLAWLLCPPANYAAALDEMLNNAYRNLSEVVRQSVVDDYGKIDLNLAKVQLQIFKELDARKHGAHVQKSLHVHRVTSKPVETKAEFETTEDIARRIQILDARIRKASNTVDVSPVEQPVSELAMPKPDEN
jgi:hypothetical protein